MKKFFAKMLSWFRVDKKKQILIQEWAQKAGYVFGKQHPEMIPQAKLIAVGITTLQGNKQQRDLKTAVRFLLKLSPELEAPMEVIFLTVKNTGEDLTPIVLAFIDGMEGSYEQV
jgi:hypothetical protein